MVSSLRLDRNLVTINPTAEKARSASKEVGRRVLIAQNTRIAGRLLAFSKMVISNFTLNRMSA